MSSKVRESKLWSWLKLGGKDFKERLHMSRVENAVGSGMADVEGCLKDLETRVGIQFWIELKCESRPTNPDTKIKPRFQPGQGPWHRRRRRSGGRTFVLLQVGAGGSARRYMLPGELIPSMQKGMTEKRLEELSVITPVALHHEIIEAAAYCDLVP